MTARSAQQTKASSAMNGCARGTPPHGAGKGSESARTSPPDSPPDSPTDSPPDSPPDSLPAVPGAGLLEALAAGREPLAELARRYGMTLEGLARWACGVGVGDASWTSGLAGLGALRLLEEARAALTVSRLRGSAAERLSHLTREASSEETQRKACVDLVTMETPGAGAASGASGASGGAEAPGEEGAPSAADRARDEVLTSLVLEALEQRGAKATAASPEAAREGSA